MKAKQMIKKVLFIIAITLISCTDEKNTRSTLQKARYSKITTTGWIPFTCGENDSFSTGFKAKNSAGQMVEGVVCCGLLKSCTIRF